MSCEHERTTTFIYRDKNGQGDGEIVCLDCLETTHRWLLGRTTEAATSSDLVGEQHDDNLVEGTLKGDAFIA